MKKNIQSIERAFQILKVIHHHGTGVTVGDLAAEANLHTSTVSRMVSTLEYVGAVERSGGRLFIGAEIIALADQAPLTERLISLATPYLREVTAVTNEAVGLTIIEGNECVVFYQLPSSHHIQIRDWTGERFPLHVTSSGKLFLAQLPDAQLGRYLDQPLAKVASETKENPADLLAELEQIHVEGVAWTIDELEDGLTSVGAPLVDDKGCFVAAVYLSVPNYRVEDKAVLAAQIKQAAASISQQLK